MATKRNKYDVQHDRLLRGYLNEIEDIYQSACLEAAKIGVSVGKLSADTVFTFKDYPITHKRIKRLMSQMAEQIQLCIVNGVQSEWTLANNKNNELCRQVFGDNIGKLTKTQYNRYFNNHDEAREAFLKRKDDGLNLSDNVWRYTNQFKTEIELGLDVGLRSGRSADELSRDLRGYLKYPDKLFRRVRDAEGNLQLSRAARAFHPGRGVYRSSYKNARRLTATETNIAYRTADYLRYQDLDFVVGIRIVLSNNHTLLGSDGAPHAFTDICDELSAPMGSKATKGRGCYPKDFKFTGWHPHCRCHVETILKSDKEIDRDTERLLQGEEPLADSVNTVSEFPEEMQTWLSTHAAKIDSAKSLPYFIRDNATFVKEVLDVAEDGVFMPIVEDAKAAGVDYLPVPKFHKQPTEKQIIERLCGGDKTEGSCSSLAFAYAANKGGLNVLDFRGGESRKFFCRDKNICNIVQKAGGKTYDSENKEMSGMELMRTAELGKEYYLGIGKHAAIVRKNANGYEYLELQSGWDNGWHELNAKIFRRRFSSYGRDYAFEMVEISRLYNDPSYRRLMGYINTAGKKQLKGASGTIK